MAFSLKNIGNFVSDKFNDAKDWFTGEDRQPELMDFRVGAGLGPDQKKIAEEKVRQLISDSPERAYPTFGEILSSTKPIKEQLITLREKRSAQKAEELSLKDASRIQVELWKRTEAGEKLTPTQLAAGREASGVFQDQLENAALASMSFESGFVSKKAAEAFAKKGVSPVKKMINALDEIKPVREGQEALFTAGRAQKIKKSIAVGKGVSGEAGFAAERAALGGELPKIQLESLRARIGQKDIDNLFDMVKVNPVLSNWEKITARGGLAKMFSPTGTNLPTRGELSLLDDVFGKEFTDAVLSKRPFWDKAKEVLEQVINIPRSVMSSFDMSFGGRQGSFAAPTFRRQFWNSWKKQFKNFGSEKAYQASVDDLLNTKHYKLAKESGVSFTDLGRIMSKREEAFMSQWAEKIPIAGKGIRASSRAYTGFANKFRMDMFGSMVDDAGTQGIKVTPDLTKSVAKFVNNATGRGSLGGLEKYAPILNAALFSPRLITSRLSLLNPQYYLTQPSFVRKQALKSLLTFAGTVGTILTLSKMGGADVENRMSSSDWGKIKINETRIDVMGGFQQYIRAGAQLLSGEYISSTTGKKTTLGEGYKPLTRYDILLRQIENKEAPVLSFITNLLKGQDFTGEKVNIGKEVIDRFTPMVIQDMYDLAVEDPDLLPIGLLGVFGIGVQTYKGRPSGGTPSLKSKSMKMPSMKGIGTFK